jgi:hypothetical protein
MSATSAIEVAANPTPAGTDVGDAVAAAAAPAPPSSATAPTAAAKQSHVETAAYAEALFDAYRKVVPGTQLNPQSQAPPPKMSRPERVELIISELRHLPGWEKVREFSVMSDKTVAAIAEVVVDRAELWEQVEMEQTDKQKIQEDMQEHINKYLDNERKNDPMPPEVALQLEEEHEARRVKEDSYYLVDVLTEADTITLNERERCIGETIEKLRTQLLKQHRDAWKTIDEQLKPKTPAQIHHARTVELRKEKVRSEWANSIKTPADLERHRAFRSFFYFHLLQTQSLELFEYAKDAYDNGAIVADKRGVVTIDPYTEKPLRRKAKQRCFITVHVPAECNINFSKTWNWRDRVTATNLADFVHSADVMDIDEIRANQTCLNFLLQYTEGYDVDTSFVMKIATICMPAQKPPEDGLSEHWAHQWLETQYAYQLCKDTCMHPMKLPKEMAFIRENIKLMPPVVECTECMAFMLRNGTPTPLDRSVLSCRPCCKKLKEEGYPRRPNCTCYAVFCSTGCAVKHTKEHHPGEMKRKFMLQAAKEEEIRLAALQIRFLRQRAHMWKVADTIEDEQKREEYTRADYAVIKARMHMDSKPKEQREADLRLRVLRRRRRELAYQRKKYELQLVKEEAEDPDNPLAGFNLFADN